MLICSVMSDSFVIPWTVAHQVSLSTVFSKQEYWRGLPFASPRDLSDLGIKAGSPALQADSLQSEPPGRPQQVTIGLQKQKAVSSGDQGSKIKVLVVLFSSGD